MRKFLKKFIEGGVLDVDKATKSVKVAISSMENLDRDKQIIGLTAWNKTIKEKGPNGSQEIWHLMNHDADLRSALGKWKELNVQGNQLVGVSHYKDSHAWREVMWPLYDGGDINQHSVGYSTISSQYVKHNGQKVERLTELELWEGSSVLWGANANTQTMEVAKSLGKKIGIYHDDMSIGKRMERMAKALKSGAFDSDTQQLFRIEFMQLQQEFADNYDITKPGKKLTSPKKLNMELIALHLL